MKIEDLLTQRRKDAKVSSPLAFASLRLCVRPFFAPRVGALVIFLTFAVPSALLVARADPPVKAPNGADAQTDVQDVRWPGPLEPIRLRLRIEIDGVPFRTAWREAFDRLFDQFDADHDGRLGLDQASQIAALFGRGAAPGSGATIPAAMMRESSLTRDEVRGFVEQASAPISLRQRPSSRGAGPALVPLLDTDGDGRLSRSELASAEESLHCRDFNDDQLITEQELLAGPSLSATSPAGESGVTEGSVILLTS